MTSGEGSASQPCDWIVVLSGPRVGQGRRRRFNANFGRLKPGVLLRRQFGVPLIISGHQKERHLLRRELEIVCRELNEPVGRPFIAHKARHTAANAIYTMGHARDVYGYELLTPDGRYNQRTIAVCTHDWHLPRARLWFNGLQQLLRAKSLPWAQAPPFQFEFIGVPSDDLEPNFWEPYADQEPAKLAADTARLERWYRKELSDAPTLVRRILNSSPGYEPGPEDNSQEGDLAMAISEIVDKTFGLEPLVSIDETTEGHQVMVTS